MLISAKTDQGSDRVPRRVFLAGPDVLRADATAAINWMAALCGAHGLEPVFPAPLPLDVDADALTETAQDCFAQTLDRLRGCDGLVANMTPFRGPSLDVGTAFLLGQALAIGLPVVGYTRDPCEYVDRVLAFYRGRLSREGALWRDPDGRVIEDLGQTDNHLVTGAVRVIARDLDQALLAFKSLDMAAGRSSVAG